MTDTPSNSGRASLADELDDALGDLSLADEPTVFLVGLSGRLAGKLFKVRRGEALIGRSSRSFLRLDEKAVSYKHACLRLSATGCHIEDLESTNGTFVNDAKITDAQLLQAGDVIRVGNNAFGFLTDAEDQQQHTRAMARLTAPRFSSGVSSSGSLPSLSPVTVPAAQVVGSSQHLARVVESPYSIASAASAVPPEDEGSALDNALDQLERVSVFIRRYRVLLLASSILGAFGGLGLAAARPPMAMADFTIYLRQDATPDPARPNQQGIGLQGGEFFAFAEQKFSDPHLVSQTLESLNPPVDKSLASAASARLSFSQIDRLGTFRGSYIDPNKSFAEKFLAAHLQTFLEAEINKSLKVQASEVSLMRHEFEKNEAELDAVEKDLQNFKEKHLATLPDVARDMIQARGTLLADRDRLMANVSRYQADLELAQRQLGSEDALASTQVARTRPYEDALAAVKKKIAEAEAKGYTAKHPELIQLREEESRLSELIRVILDSPTNDPDRKANAEFQRLKARVGEVGILLTSSKKELGQVETRLAEIASISVQMPEVEGEITRLLRKQSAAKEIHERLLVELKRKELELKFERASVAARYELMQPPRAQQPARSAAFLKFGGAGIAGGLILGILIAMGHWITHYARNRRIKVTIPAGPITRTD